MSGLRVNTLRGETAGSSPTFPDGIVVTGVVTATSFSGSGASLTGIDSTALKDSGGNVKVQANTSGIVVTGVATATQFSGNITGVAATFTGNVSVGGVLTYEDVTNVDSIGVITARSGIRIGAGQSVSAVSGIVTYYGDGSQLTGVESGVSNFIASGTIPNGQTVIINADGTVSAVTKTPSPNAEAGTPVVFDGNYAAGDGAYDSVSGKVVFAYQDGGNSSYGTAIVGTVSGTSISFGTPVVFQSSHTNSYGVAYDSANEKIVIAYVQVSDYHGRAIVGTVSGTSISFGSAVKFVASSIAQVAAAYDSTAEKVLITYRDLSNHGAAIVGTVSGTSISFGSVTVFEAAQTGSISQVHDVTNNKMVVVYCDEADSGKGKAIVGTISGTSISFGTAVTFDSGSNIFPSRSAYDSSNSKVIIAYKDSANSNYGTAIVGTVSGTSISFGTESVFESATVDALSIVYDSVNQKILIGYQDGGDSNYAKAVVGTVSGTSISFGTPVSLENSASYVFSAAYDVTNTKAVFAWGDGSSEATAVAFGATSETTNLTTENYIGIAAEAISDGETGKVNILGGVNTGQTGLTTAQTHYVQADGSLSTSADTPSVVAGTGISSTSILIWKS